MGKQEQEISVLMLQCNLPIDRWNSECSSLGENTSGNPRKPSYPWSSASRGARGDHVMEAERPCRETNAWSSAARSCEPCSGQQRRCRSLSCLQKRYTLPFLFLSPAGVRQRGPSPRGSPAPEPKAIWQWSSSSFPLFLFFCPRMFPMVRRTRL